MFVFFANTIYITAGILIILAIGSMISIILGAKREDAETVVVGAVVMTLFACALGGFAAFLQWMLG